MYLNWKEYVCFIDLVKALVTQRYLENDACTALSVLITTCHLISCLASLYQFVIFQIFFVSCDAFSIHRFLAFW